MVVHRLAIAIAVGSLLCIAGDTAAARHSIDQNPPLHHPAARALAPAGTSLATSSAPFSWDFFYEVLMVGLAAIVLGVFTTRRMYRFPGELKPDSSRAGMGISAFLLMLAALYIGAVLAVQFVDPLPQTSGDAPDILTGARAAAEIELAAKRRMIAYAVAAPVAIIGLWYLEKARRRAGEAVMPADRGAIIGLAAIIVIWPIIQTVGAAVRHAVELLTELRPPRVAHETLDLILLADSGPWVWVTVAVIVLAVPIFEEVMYRGFLQQGLVHLVRSRWAGIFLTSIIFALMHYPAVEVHALVVLFVLSLGFGYLYQRTGSLIAPIAMHALFNGVNILLTALIAQSISSDTLPT